MEKEKVYDIAEETVRLMKENPRLGIREAIEMAKEIFKEAK